MSNSVDNEIPITTVNNVSLIYAIDVPDQQDTIIHFGPFETTYKDLDRPNEAPIWYLRTEKELVKVQDIVSRLANLERLVGDLYARLDKQGLEGFIDSISKEKH